MMFMIRLSFAEKVREQRPVVDCCYMDLEAFTEPLRNELTLPFFA